MHAPMTMLTVDLCARMHARNTPSRLAIADHRAALTYAQLDARIDKVVAALSAMGLAPKSVDFWPELPKSAVGKVVRRVVREQFWAGRNRSLV